MRAACGKARTSCTLSSSLRTRNRALWWVVGGALGGLALALYLPPMQHIFKFEGLSLSDLAWCALAASAGIVWSEIVKLGKVMTGRAVTKKT